MRGLLAALLVAGCGERPIASPVQTQTARGEALGTTWSVVWVGDAAPTDVSAAATAVLAQVDERMSTWRDDSELAAIRAGTGPVPVSEETWFVVDAALDLAEASGGAFDPTVEPLMELWGFHGDPREDLPTDEQLAAARAQVGWTRVALSRTTEGAPLVDSGGTALDLSAIAKGHAVDRISHALSALGIAEHLVEVGGEVRGHGLGPSGTGWRLGVDRPDPAGAPGAELEEVVHIVNASVATSGNYRNAYEVDGVRLVHTMDPRTGRPHDSALASATVLAPDCRTADGLATALMVLGPEDGLALVERMPDVEALLLVSGPEGFGHRGSSGLAAHTARQR